MSPKTNAKTNAKKTNAQTSPAAYLAALPPDRRKALAAVRAVIRNNLPRGFEEGMGYGMISYHVPLARHPDTYNGQPLCLAAIASQKQYMSLYLMSIYADAGLRRWFEAGYRASGKRLDVGKACIRFRSLDDLPLPLVGEAIRKVGVDRFIAQYEASRAGRR
jgi:hypothetical protein